MISNFDILLSLWSETLKTTMYILNRVPFKLMSKTPFELWNGWKPNLNHTHVCGCLIKVRIYNLQLKKLDLRTTSDYFIGYIVNFKGYRFYYPSHTTRILEARDAKFLEDLNFSGSGFPKMIEF
jgi:hypothetical protein